MRLIDILKDLARKPRTLTFDESAYVEAIGTRLRDRRPSGKAQLLMAEGLTPDAIEEATRRLTTYLGPIAKVVAKRAATQATNRRHFHMLLAEQLTDPRERARFLHDVGAE